MRFMMIVIPEVYQSQTTPADAMPNPDAMAKMMEYNKGLQKAGVLLSLDGLTPPAVGARISFTGGKPTVTDGPFADAKEVIGGYWIIDVRSREEAIEWAKRAPMMENDRVEVRQIQNLGDFPDEVRKAAAGLEDLQNTGAAKSSAKGSTGA